MQSPQVARLLVEDGRCDVNRADEDGEGPLLKAITYKRYFLARYLVERGGANVLLRDNVDGRNPLTAAVSAN
jgi:ankyrin repeat protein